MEAKHTVQEGKADILSSFQHIRSLYYTDILHVSNANTFPDKTIKKKERICLEIS